MKQIQMITHTLSQSQPTPSTLLHLVQMKRLHTSMVVLEPLLLILLLVLTPVLLQQFWIGVVISMILVIKLHLYSLLVTF